MRDSSIEIGDFEASEAERLGVIFFDAVRVGATEFYDFEQRQAWASRPASGPTWVSRHAFIRKRAISFEGFSNSRVGMWFANSRSKGLA